MLVDGDTGYGEALNVMHMVRAFEEAGAGAVHIEDQLLPKKCGHLNNKKLADPHDMAAKVAAAAKARRHLFIIARTDAAASEGIDGAVARARLYLEAGADAIFPEALTNAEMFRAFAKAMPGVQLLANMTEFGRTPFFTAAEFEAMGYKMVIWPVSSLRVANKAQASSTRRIKRDGGTQNMLDRHADPRRALRRRSATTTTRRSTPRSSRPSSRRACRSVRTEHSPQRAREALPLKPQRRQIGRAAVEVGRVLEGLAQPQHVAFGEGLADDLDADRQAARLAGRHREAAQAEIVGRAASGSPGSARSRRLRPAGSPAPPWSAAGSRRRASPIR